MPDDGVRTAIAARVADTRFVLDVLQEIADGNNPDAGRRPLPDGLRAQRAYLGAFFDRFLRGIPQPLLQRPSPRYPEVVFQR
ncbi:hypothetical protein ACWCOV_29020 [Kribbella sp. NPDC002412]